MNKLKSYAASKRGRDTLLCFGIVIIAYIIVQAAIAGGGISSQIKGLLVPICAYVVMAISLNLTVGILGELSLGHAGFMSVGAFAGIVTTTCLADAIPLAPLRLAVAMVVAGLFAAIAGVIVGVPVLRLKGDYLAIITLGFAEIMRTIIQWNAIGPLTNASNLLKGYPDFSSATAYLLLIGVFIACVVLLVNSTYGRAFKAIRDDEVAAEAMGINLAHHKRLAFVISSFFAGVGGGMLAMYMGAVQAMSFRSSMTYEILLLVVIGGIGSITGSVLTSFLYIAALEWLLRGLDTGEFLGITAPGLFKNGFRMAVISVIIMVVVLFFRKGIMGDKELPDLLRRHTKKGGGEK